MKKWITLIIVSITVMTLTGCQSSATNQNGFFHNILVEPFVKAIHAIGTFLGGDFGLAIIVITLIIRLILLPLMLRTYKNQQLMKVKMDKLKPEMDTIQKKIKATKNAEEQRKLQQEMMGLYQKHGVNPLQMGCLPILIQMPVLFGLYYAIRGSHEIATHTFLWFNLGHPDIAMTIIAGIVYLAQSQVTLVGLPEAQKKQMKMIGLLSPVMIVFISLSSPAALPLYWTVGGLFLIGQTLLSKKYYQSHIPELKKEANKKVTLKK
jgi:YidC/Oxa1 family membrane protein insertase